MFKQRHAMKVIFKKFLAYLVVGSVGGGGKIPKIHTLFRTSTSILLPCLGHAIPCLYLGQTRAKLYTLFRTYSHKITNPVSDREAKNHTLSSRTSPYRPYKGIPPGVIGSDWKPAGMICMRNMSVG